MHFLKIGTQQEGQYTYIVYVLIWTRMYPSHNKEGGTDGLRAMDSVNFQEKLF